MPLLGNIGNVMYVVVALVGGALMLTDIPNISIARSEERRVGKECRSRWSPYH